ncbi:MAG TPA: hypothetical protein VNJ08_00145 [Bacteriovoracaceae bacterium]|nr:hypothetical protein [Bacteriovoracaceae bacterium]
MHIAFLLIFLSFSSWATTFSLQSMDQQIKEADGVIVGHYLKSKSIKLDSGTVATQMIFKVQLEWGMQSELFGMEEVIIHYPGGKIGDLQVQVQGVPHFVVGEKVALFVKNIDNRYWGHNLGFGTFKIVSYGKETMLVNTLFPTDLRVGQVKMEQFESKVKFIKGSSLKVVRNDYPTSPEGTRSPAAVNDGKKRAIASKIEQADNREDQSSLNVYWLISILALAGGITRLVRARDA